MDEISWLEVSGLIPQAVPSERMLGMSVLVPESQVERSGEEPSPTLLPHCCITDPCSRASTWTAADPREISLCQTTSHSQCARSPPITKAERVHVRTHRQNTHTSSCAHTFPLPRQISGTKRPGCTKSCKRTVSILI